MHACSLDSVPVAQTSVMIANWTCSWQTR